MKNKRGISPLIATVLIIGFTVALAAVVMTWGNTFVRETTDSTREATQNALLCANLNFLIDNYGCTGDPLVLNTITLANNGEKVLQEVVLRGTKQDNTVVTETLTTNLASFGVQTYTVPVSLQNAVKIEAIAKVQTDTGEVITCADAKRTKNIVCT